MVPKFLSLFLAASLSGASCKEAPEGSLPPEPPTSESATLDGPARQLPEDGPRTVPEPAIALLGALGLLAIAWRRHGG